jgi:hypothetical protein
MVRPASPPTRTLTGVADSVPGSPRDPGDVSATPPLSPTAAVKASRVTMFLHPPPSEAGEGEQASIGDPEGALDLIILSCRLWSPIASRLTWLSAHPEHAEAIILTAPPSERLLGR